MSLRALLLVTVLSASPAWAQLQPVAVDEKLRPETAPAQFRDHLLSGSPCGYCPELVRLPSGRFLMGAFPWEGHSDEHGPGDSPFSVALTAPLAMSTHEISRREYQAFLTAVPDYQPHQGCAGMVDGHFETDAGQGWQSPGFSQADDEPVVCVSWHDATAYADWLSKQTGAQYRLPSEAEWEYAARAGTLTRYWWGDRIDQGRANCRDRRCDQTYPYTAPPLAMPPNRFGLYHMLGNVWEWVADCYDADAYRRQSSSYPEPLRGSHDCKRVIRGGSWAEGVWSLRATNREGWVARKPLNDIGFRVVREGQDTAL
ncbi:formylglycine-generating enzyme family protein [Motiliproteus sediminis]|uniref:formylglycine-generating enzyme family protein n=1 Tax=Motiliproteus sediminis TaxID=1468178 RepID=UPI001AEFA0BD|nr:SUMF1/EgtB/PvdO family nonheme iron enzyme [Motiliproteus sediminis]